jgi:hypothetical protein
MPRMRSEGTSRRFDRVGRQGSLEGGLLQLVKQRLRLFQIGRVEALGEPAVDRGEKVVGVGVTALVAAEPGEARGGTQFPEFGLLLLGDAQGFTIKVLGSPGMPPPQQQLALVPV